MCTHHRRVLVTLLTFGMILPLLGLVVSPSFAGPPSPVKIGLPKSLFRDVPDPLIQMLMVPFGSLMKSQTGMDGKMLMVDKAMDLAQKLETKEFHLGVFHGYEFAWAQEKYPNLRPLVIAVNRHTELSASLVTRKDSNLSTFADSQGKQLSLPNQSRAHCYLFLERHCEERGCQPGTFFSKICNHSDIETALDAVILGEVECIVVDGVALDCYREVKPGCFNRLKIIQQSPVFPAAVIAYREGTLEQTTLDRFKNGMINAKNNYRARNLMTMWKLTGFAPIPANYQETLANIRRAYPSPEAVLQAASQKMP